MNRQGSAHAFTSNVPRSSPARIAALRAAARDPKRGGCAIITAPPVSCQTWKCAEPAGGSTRRESSEIKRGMTERYRKVSGCAMSHPVRPVNDPEPPPLPPDHQVSGPDCVRDRYSPLPARFTGPDRGKQTGAAPDRVRNGPGRPPPSVGQGLGPIPVKATPDASGSRLASTPAPVLCGLPLAISGPLPVALSPPRPGHWRRAPPWPAVRACPA